MVDLHVHTNCSDGTDSVIELLKRAEAKKLQVISITDHETCKAYDEMKHIEISQYYSGKIITGVELRTVVEGVSIELLGYGVDTDLMNTEIGKLYMTQADKNVIEYERLYKKCVEAGIIFGDDFCYNYDTSKYKYGAQYLLEMLTKHEVNKGIIQDEDAWLNIGSFYRRYMSNPQSQLYTDVADLSPTVDKVITLIRSAGGLVFVPHIYQYESNSEKVFRRLIQNYKIDGIECIHPIFTAEQTNYLIQFCRENNFYTSGGSDYHGKRNPEIEVGIGRGNLDTSYEFVQDWINKVRTVKGLIVEQ